MRKYLYSIYTSVFRRPNPKKTEYHDFLTETLFGGATDM